MAQVQPGSVRRARVSVLLPDEDNSNFIRRTQSCDYIRDAEELEIDGEVLTPQYATFEEKSSVGCMRRRNAPRSFSVFGKGSGPRMCTTPLDSSFLRQTSPRETSPPSLTKSVSHSERFVPYTLPRRPAEVDFATPLETSRSASALGEEMSGLAIEGSRAGFSSTAPMVMSWNTQRTDDPAVSLSEYLEGADTVSTSVCDDDTDTMDHSQSEGTPLQEETFGLPPTDWSLKTSVRFLSAEPFEWCKKGSAALRGTGLLEFLHGIRAEVPTEDARDAAFHKALLLWQFPATAVPAQFSTLGDMAAKRAPKLRTAEETEIVEFFLARQRAWDQSWCSLFEMFQREACPYFYCQLPVPKCTLVFQAAHINGNTKPRMVASTSTKSLRENLRKNGVCFIQPNKRPRKHPTSEDDTLDDNTPHALLIVEGRTDLRAVFNFILNFRGAASASPVLYSPVGFENAAVRALHWSQQLLTRRVSGARAEEVHAIDVAGPVLPGAVLALCSLFKNTQGSFEGAFRTDRSSRALNFIASPAHAHPPTPVAGGEARAFGAMDPSAAIEEHVARLYQQTTLADRVLSHVECDGSRFSYKTTLG